MEEKPTFGKHHADQYKLVSDDMRFYADQRFKILSLYLIVSGLLANVAKDYDSIILAAFGMIISGVCLFWDATTSRWWGTLIERAKAIEDFAGESSAMIQVYYKYRCQNAPSDWTQKMACCLKLTPTKVARFIYIVGFIAWALYFLNSFPHLWYRLN